MGGEEIETNTSSRKSISGGRGEKGGSTREAKGLKREGPANLCLADALTGSRKPENTTLSSKLRKSDPGGEKRQRGNLRGSAFLMTDRSSSQHRGFNGHQMRKKERRHKSLGTVSWERGREKKGKVRSQEKKKKRS